MLGTVLGKGDAEMSKIMRTLLHGPYTLLAAGNKNQVHRYVNMITSGLDKCNGKRSRIRE